jgi:hypothetical protein
MATGADASPEGSGRPCRALYADDNVLMVSRIGMMRALTSSALRARRIAYFAGALISIFGPSCLGEPPFFRQAGGSIWSVEFSFSLQMNSIIS